MPIHRGTRLNDLIVRLPRPIALQANIYKTWPDLADGITLTNPNTWYQIIAAASAPTTPFTCVYMRHQPSTGSASELDVYLELGVGGAGAETAIASCTTRSGSSFTRFEPYPVIPGGSRVSIRTQNAGRKGASLTTALLPPRYDPATILRLAAKENQQRGYGLPGIVNVAYPGASVSAGGVWTYGSWNELLPSTGVTENCIVTALDLAAVTNGLAWQWQFALGYGGTDGAANAPTATCLEVGFSAYPRDNNYMSCHLELPVPILWNNATRITGRLASDQGTGSSYYGVSAVKGWVYP